MSRKSDDELAVGCLAFIVKFIILIMLWVELDHLLPEKYDYALTLGMLLLLL